MFHNESLNNKGDKCAYKHICDSCWKVFREHVYVLLLRAFGKLISLPVLASQCNGGGCRGFHTQEAPGSIALGPTILPNGYFLASDPEVSSFHSLL